MMRAAKRLTALLSLIGILASCAFAAPLCTLCAPPSAKSFHHAAHDHCGSMPSDVQNSPSIANSHCEHHGAACIKPSEHELPALVASSLAPVISVATSVQETVVSFESASPPVPRTFDSSRTSVLLTTKLRV